MRELNVKEIEAVNGGHPVIWLGGYVLRYAAKKLINHVATKAAVAGAGGAYAGSEGYEDGNE